MVSLKRLPATAAVNQMIAALEQDGGVIVDAFLDDKALSAIKGDLLPLLEAQSSGRDAFAGHSTRRLSRLFAHTRHCAEVVTHPLFLATATHFVAKPREVWHGAERKTITPDVRIGATQAIQIGPGQGEQPLHRDDNAFLWKHPTGGYEGRLQIMVALSDFTAENGATLVIPGSHKWDDERMPERSDAIPAVMAAGSALLFLGSTYHAGGNNRTTDQTRTGLTMALDASHVRQEENMYLSLSTEVVASYPEEIQRLLGWSAGRNHMGWIEVDGQMTDPNFLVQAGGFSP